MSELAFISPGEARAEGGFAPRAASPLARALAGARGLRDVSSLGKLEVRGGVPAGLGDDVEVLRISPDRALLVCAPERVAGLRRSVAGFVVDLTGALAAIELDDARLLPRLTDLDLGALPSAGKLAGVTAIVAATESGVRIFFAQEYGDSVVEAVRDAQEAFA